MKRHEICMETHTNDTEKNRNEQKINKMFDDLGHSHPTSFTISVALRKLMEKHGHSLKQIHSLDEI